MTSLICVGRLKESFYAEGAGYYSDGHVRIIEAPDESAPQGLSEARKRQITEKEGEAILKRIGAATAVVALDINGAKYTKEKIGDIIRAHRDVAFVIGGSLGLGRNVLERADYRWSLSAMTLPHQLARVLCLALISH